MFSRISVGALRTMHGGSGGAAAGWGKMSNVLTKTVLCRNASATARDIYENVLQFKEYTDLSENIEVDGSSMTLEKLVALGKGCKMYVSEETVDRLIRSRAIVDDIVDSEVPTYGINTGFGLMSHTNVPKEQLQQLQANLIRSHASGVGKALEPEVVRRILALRINTLARGRSGVSLTTFNGMLKMFNSGLTPEVPCQGTVGASGDLAPLAHIALGLMGEGMMFDPATLSYRPAKDALEDYGLAPIKLKAKDGLSLVNGTQFITGIGSFALEAALKSCQVAQAISALSLIAIDGHINAYDHRVAACRPHAGTHVVASLLRGLVPFGSTSTTELDVQDAYCMRCVPQVHGPVLEMLSTLRASLELELNSSTDNPLIFEDNICPQTGRELPKVVSAGNFHGEYPAKALDTLAIYIGEIGRISVARVLLLVDPNRNRGLPAFLTQNPGLNSGLMCWELTACALDAENRTSSMPASAESNLTGAGKEDHVSMGGYSARKAVQVAENVQKILSIELLAATHAIHGKLKLNGEVKMPDALRAVFQRCAKLSPPLDQDRYLKYEHQSIHDYAFSDLRDLAIEAAAQEAIGSTTVVSHPPGSAWSPTSGQARRYLHTAAVPGRKHKIGVPPGMFADTSDRFYSSSRLLCCGAAAITGVAVMSNYQDAKCESSCAGPSVVLASGETAAYLTHPNALVSQLTSRRALQTNIGELPQFSLDGMTINTLADLDAALAATRIEGDAATSQRLFIVDSSEDDYGSRANFGRGNDHKVLIQKICPSAYEVFLKRLSNVAINALNGRMARELCLLGSITSTDLKERTENLNASVAADRIKLIEAVKTHHERLTNIIARVIKSENCGGLYLVNGDHNHMLSAIEGFYMGSCGVKPVVVYIDLHADARPSVDGPHSGTWCSQAFELGLIDEAHVVGLNPLANTDETIKNLDKFGVSYQPYTWDQLKAGDMTMERAALRIVETINSNQNKVRGRPIILSICGDSVLGLPSSAGTGTIGYSADEVYRFVTIITKHCDVRCFTVAELKPSLQPSAAALVGEFLTQCLFLYHKNQMDL